MLLRTVLRSLGSWVAAILLLLSLALAPSQSLASSKQLSSGPQMLHPRAAHTATTLADGRVFIAGGCTADSCDLTADGATTEIFVPAQNAFVTGPVLGTPRVSHAALRLADGRVLLIGGWTPDGPAASTEMFDPATNAVSPGPEMGSPRADAVVALLANGQVLIAGGYDGESALASAEMYDPVTNTMSPTGAMTTARTSHAGVTLADGRILIMGGSDREGHVVAGAELFDPATGTFVPTGSMAAARYKFGAALLGNGRALVAAGTDERDAGGAMRSTEIYDPASGAFQDGPPLLHARYKIAGSLVALPGERVLIAGGADEVELVAPMGSEQLEPPLKAALSFPTASLLADGRVLITGGYDPALRVSNQTWLYQPG